MNMNLSAKSHPSFCSNNSIDEDDVQFHNPKSTVLPQISSNVQFPVKMARRRHNFKELLGIPIFLRPIMCTQQTYRLTSTVTSQVLDQRQPITTASVPFVVQLPRLSEIRFLPLSLYAKEHALLIHQNSKRFINFDLNESKWKCSHSFQSQSTEFPDIWFPGNRMPPKPADRATAPSPHLNLSLLVSFVASQYPSIVSHRLMPSTSSCLIKCQRAFLQFGLS